MIHNPYFWIGEIGLLLTIISSFVLVHRLRYQHWLSVAPIYLVMLTALSLLVHPVVRVQMETLPEASYFFRLAVGLVFGGRTWFYQRVAVDPTQPDLVRDINLGNRIIRWASVAGGVFLSYVYWKLKSR